MLCAMIGGGCLLQGLVMDSWNIAMIGDGCLLQ